MNNTSIALLNILNTVSDVAIIGTDSKGTILYFNAGAEQLLGYTAHELIQKHTFCLFHDGLELQVYEQQYNNSPHGEVKADQLIKHAATNQAFQQNHWKYIRKDHTYIKVSIAVQVVGNTTLRSLSVDEGFSITNAQINGLYRASETGLNLYENIEFILQVTPLALQVADMSNIAGSNSGKVNQAYQNRGNIRKKLNKNTRELYYTAPHADSKAALKKNRYDTTFSLEKDSSGYTYFSQYKLAQAQLLENEQRLLEAEKMAKIGSWELNLKTNEAYFSEQFFHIYEITDEKDKKPFYTENLQGLTYVHPDEKEYVRSIIEKAFTDIEDFTLEHRSVTKSGKLIHIYSNCRVKYSITGEAEKLYGTIQDITERKHREAELIKARQQAEEAAQAKQQFLSVMSHELRTPMNAVIGMTYLLLQEDPKEEQLENLEMLKFSSENLLALINDILDFSKIEAGKITFEHVNFSIKEIITGVKHTLGMKADEKNIHLRDTIDAGIPEFLVGDPVRLTQILNNLVSNAIKFTEEGSVNLAVQLQKEYENQVYIKFSVADTGIGIAPDKLQYIFESFSQASEDITRKYGGTGLGLSITKRLLELQNSHIEVESEPGKGSRFYFSLCFGKSHDKHLLIEAKPVKVHPDALIDIKLLLVEDNQINQMVATKFLNKWNIFPDYAWNGKAAVEQVQVKDYDIILMDLQMPEMNGYEATQVIRSMAGEKYKRIPIIALTADVVEDVKNKVLAAGMTDLLTKPFNPNNLYKKIVTYLDTNITIKVSGQVAEKPLNADALANYSKVQELAGGDMEFLSQLKKSCKISFEQFKNEYSEALLIKDAARLQAVIHKMKPTILLLELQNPLDEVENGKQLLTGQQYSQVQVQRSIEIVNTICDGILLELHS